jgi:hypothetical protein
MFGVYTYIPLFQNVKKIQLFLVFQNLVKSPWILKIFFVSLFIKIKYKLCQIKKQQ